MLFASPSKWDDGAARGRLGFEGRSQASAQTAAVQLAQASCALLRMDVRPSKSTAQKSLPHVEPFHARDFHHCEMPSEQD
jgi:hypothetical protein